MGRGWKWWWRWSSQCEVKSGGEGREWGIWPGGGEAERTSGSSPVGMYFAFWKTRLLTIESGLPGKGQTSASASAPAQARAWASAVTATEAGAGVGTRVGAKTTGAVAVAERGVPSPTSIHALGSLG